MTVKGKLSTLRIGRETEDSVCLRASCKQMCYIVLGNILSQRSTVTPQAGEAAEAPDVSWGGNIHPVSSATSSQHRALLSCRSSSSSVSLMPTSTLSLLAKLIPIEKYLKGRISGIRYGLNGEVKKRKELFSGRL